MKELRFSKEGRSLSVVEIGHGPIVILAFPGFACTHEIYLDFIALTPELALHCTFYILNYLSDKNELLLDDFVLDAEFVLAEMAKVRKIATVLSMGISMGGFVAQLFAQKHAESLKGLVLMCTTSCGEGFIHPTPLTEAGLIQFATFDPSMAAAFQANMVTHPTCKYQAEERFKRIIEERKRSFTLIALADKIKQNKAAILFLKGDFPLAEFKAPVFAICGENDRFVNPDNVDIFKQYLPQTMVKKIPESDHYFFMEKPEEVGQALMGFLKEKVLCD